LREVGRPDLAVATTVSVKDLAGMLYDSIQKIKALDGALRLYPGHGAGSACGKSIGGGNFCDIKTQCEHNYAFLLNDKNEFVEKVSKDLPAPPKYFFYDAKMNQEGISVMY
jgi:glyoxylase-like metal-dependent hydrolase (beta-lactamase superfamily II)